MRLRRLPPLIALVTSLVAAGSAGAQSARPLSSLSAGDQVRYTVNNVQRDRWTAALAAVAGDSLYLRPDAAGPVVPVAMNRLVGLEVSVGKVTQRRKDAVLGGIAGAVGGAILVAMKSSTTKPYACGAFSGSGACQDAEPHRDLVGGAMKGAAAGLVIGFGIGGFDKRDRWTAVALPAMTGAR